jgi:Rap1a immunity proteins
MRSNRDGEQHWPARKANSEVLNGISRKKTSSARNRHFATYGRGPGCNNCLFSPRPSESRSGPWHEAQSHSCHPARASVLGRSNFGRLRGGPDSRRFLGGMCRNSGAWSECSFTISTLDLYDEFQPNGTRHSCPPRNSPKLETALVVSWLKTHPETRNVMKQDGILAALRALYPCI